MSAHFASRGLKAWLLLPVTALYSLASGIDRLRFSLELAHEQEAGVPVIVVGNVTAGGTGKSPLVRALAQQLAEDGHRPGIVLRGYGGRATTWPQLVNADSDPVMVGDEAVEHASLTGLPVAVAPKRVLAARALVEQGCTVVISDDGLQHHALARNLEIGVIDGARGFGNGMRLPSGPLRESPKRLRRCGWVVVNGNPCLEIQNYAKTEQNVTCMEVVADTVSPLNAPSESSDFSAVSNTPTILMTAVGNPDRISDSLKAVDVSHLRADFPDHHVYRVEDIVQVGEQQPSAQLVMTAKDGVKVRALELAPELRERCWVIGTRCEVDEQVLASAREVAGDPPAAGANPI